MNKYYISMLVSAFIVGLITSYYGITYKDWGFYVLTGLIGLNYSFGRMSK